MKNKIRCFIVDDEELFREYLKTTVNWEYNGFQIIGEAKNGQNALDSVRKEPPDVMFIDIDMPHMDGLTLIDEMRKEKSDVLFVLITGYGDFRYAQRAIKLGVFDYLLKPFTQEDLLICLIKIRQHFEEHQAEKSGNQISDARTPDRILQQLVLGEYEGTAKDLSDMFEKYAIRVSLNKSLFACSIEYYDYNEIWVTAKERRTLTYAVTNILQEISGPDTNFALFRMDDNLFGLVINSDVNDSAEKQMLLKIQELCEKHLKIHMNIGIGGLYNGIEGFCLSWGEATTARKRNTEKNILGITLHQSTSGQMLDAKSYYHILNREEPPYRKFIQKDVHRKASWSHLLIVRAIKYMQSNYMYDLSIEKIANGLFVSSSYLRKVFSNEMKSTTMQVLLDIRMDQACQMLIDGSHSIASIAEKVGYNDSAYFSRVFRRHFGITPSAFELIWKKRDI